MTVLFTTEARSARHFMGWRAKEVVAYPMMGLGGAAVLSAFIFRRPIFIGVNQHQVELWLLVLIIGLATFSVGAISVFRSVN